jgi:hypothetical protein
VQTFLFCPKQDSGLSNDGQFYGVNTYGKSINENHTEFNQLASLKPLGTYDESRLTDLIKTFVVDLQRIDDKAMALKALVKPTQLEKETSNQQFTEDKPHPTNAYPWSGLWKKECLSFALCAGMAIAISWMVCSALGDAKTKTGRP